MSKKKHKGEKHKAHEHEGREQEELGATVPAAVPGAASAAGTALAGSAAAPIERQDTNRKIMYEPIREYRLKFYLNAQHYVVFNGKRGETHPHTWEFTLAIEVSGLETTPFSVFERGVESYLAPYQNKVMNDCAPFDTMLPTLENLVEEFVGPFGEIIEDAGGRLVSLEGSEGPTRTYILRERHEAQAEFEKQDLRAERARVIDAIVADSLDDAAPAGESAVAVPAASAHAAAGTAGAEA